VEQGRGNAPGRLRFYETLPSKYPAELRGSRRGLRYNFSRGFAALFPMLVGYVAGFIPLGESVGLFAGAGRRRRDLALGLTVAYPAAKLATARMLDIATASHSLGETLGLGSVSAREIHATLDWLGSHRNAPRAPPRQGRRAGALRCYLDLPGRTSARTSTCDVHWYVVSADDKDNARLIVSRTSSIRPRRSTCDCPKTTGAPLRAGNGPRAACG
jgi:hypothetical protein